MERLTVVQKTTNIPFLCSKVRSQCMQEKKSSSTNNRLTNNKQQGKFETSQRRCVMSRDQIIWDLNISKNFETFFFLRAI